MAKKTKKEFWGARDIGTNELKRMEYDDLG